MVLEQELDYVSAKWDNDNNKWQIGQKTKYRWVNTISNEPTSEWYYSIEEALDWIKAVDNPVNIL